MKEISLLDILYTGIMIFAIFYGAIMITSFFSGKMKEDEVKDKEEEN